MGHFPAGMEFFGSVDDSSINTIKKMIRESDIYIIIVKGRYGSISDAHKISYTELEYDYAVKIRKPILVFVLDDNKAPLLKTERDNDERLSIFKKKLANRQYSTWTNSHELASQINSSLQRWIHEQDKKLKGGFISLSENFEILAEVLRRRRSSSQRHSFEFLEDNEDILVLQNGYPHFSIDEISITDSDKRLLIGIPEQFREELQSGDPNGFNFKSRENLSFDSSNGFQDLEEITKIKGLRDKIKKHSIDVAIGLQELKKKNMARFNGEMFGVKSVSHSRDQYSERPRISIHLYHTDYFTYRVFASIYKELKNEGHAISKVKVIEDLMNAEVDYSPFLSSFGIAAFILTNNNNDVILSLRSGLTTHLKEDNAWHYTMNEAFSQTDIEDNLPSLHACFNRGLKEELGLSNKTIQSHAPKFTTLLFHRNRFEMGINAYISMPNLKLDELDAFRKHKSKDGSFESEKIKSLPLEKDAVLNFLKKDKYGLTDGAKIGLKNLLIRKMAGDF